LFGGGHAAGRRDDNKEVAMVLGARKKLMKTLNKKSASSSPANSAKSQNADRETLSKLISERAYYIWEEKGKPSGDDFNIWLQAENEIRAKFCK